MSADPRHDAPLKFPSPEPDRADDGRAAPRAAVPPMYTLLRAKRPGDEQFRWSGHLYDVSMTGMRFELDEPLKTGEQVQVRAMLPGTEHITIRVEGRVARMHEDGPGPVRMGLLIERFLGPHDRRKLTTYLQDRLGTADVTPKPMPQAEESTPLRKAA
ncbi:MAG: PilZ domain-containing protein [Planctomycetota bacterium]